jgi:glycosyltransferase involved in cell wall biosynthesis
MRLTFITNLYPPYVIGGNEMLCEEVVAALRRRGHEVSVICGHGARLAADGVRGALEIDLDRKEETFLGGRLPSPWEAFKLHLFSPASYRATRRLLKTLDPDLVVVWNLYMASMSPLIAARRHGRPIVVHVFDKWLYYGLVDLESLLRPAVPWKRLALRIARRMVQPLVRRLAQPEHVIAASRFMRDFYVRAGFDAAVFDVELLGVPTREFPVASRVPRAAGAPLRLLFIGALWEGKGPLTAVRALARLLRLGVNATLAIYGEGVPHFVEALRRLISDEGLSSHVTLHGRVPRATVSILCGSHDVFVFPSEWDEPFAAVPLEAMSCGMAVVATTAGGTPEAIDDGETGLLVPPRDPDALAAALRRIADDDSLRLRLGARAARSVRQRFEFEDYVGRLEVRYRALAGSRPVSDGRGATATTPRRA